MPLQLYFLDGRAKVEIGLARGKKEYDKRQALRERQDSREVDRAVQARKTAEVQPSLRIRWGTAPK